MSRDAQRVARRVVTVLSLLAVPAPVHAQADGATLPHATGSRGDPGIELLPRVRYFASPTADPIEPRFGIGLIMTDVLAEPGTERAPFELAGDARSDWQAAAAIGGTLPFWRPATWPGGGIAVGAQAGVFARFRIELPSRDDLGQDWLVAMPIEAAWNNWSGRLRISHRSAHLGDEFVEETDADRIEFGGESIDGLVAYEFPRLARVYGGGGWIFRSNTDDTSVLQDSGTQDRFVVQLGADGRWDVGSPYVHALAGVDWQAAERTGWVRALALAGGLGIDVGDRSLDLMLRYFDGPSSMGQFFVTPETFWSLELVASL